MATIQIREIPEDAYEVIRKRARSEGKSIQGYMRERVLEMAGQPTKAEALATIERALATGRVKVSVSSIVADVNAERR